MRVQTMRHVDRWLGIPLCAVATLLARLRRPPPRAAAPPRRILFIELAEMGSAVLAAPALQLARERYPDAELHFLTFAEHAETVAVLGLVPRARLHAIRTGNLRQLAADSWRCLRRCRALPIDAVVDLELFTRYSALLAWLSGAGARSGFERFLGEGLYRGRLMTRPVQYSPHRHIALNYLALVEALAGDPSPAPRLPLRLDAERLRPPRAAVDPAAERRVAALLHSLGVGHGSPLLLLNPNGGPHLPQRRWPLERYAELARRLLARHDGLTVGIVGAAGDSANGAELHRRVDTPHCHDLSGRLGIAELLALFARADALVSNDSGPAHLAATVGLPTVVLFGPETPALYRPLGGATALYADLACSPCITAANGRQTPCRDNACLQAIPVDEVYRQTARLLGTMTAVVPAARAS